MARCFVCEVEITEGNTGYFRPGRKLSSICKECNRVYALAATIRKLSRDQQFSKIGDLNTRAELYKIIHDNPELSKLEQVKLFFGR